MKSIVTVAVILTILIFSLLPMVEGVIKAAANAGQNLENKQKLTLSGQAKASTFSIK